MQLRVILAAVLPLALAGCDREVQSNPNAPGRPGTGDPPEVAQPIAPDTPPGSGGDAVPGVTGSGSPDPAGRSRTETAQPGQGLTGGLGAPEAATATGNGADAAADATRASGGTAAGSPNRTPDGNVGNR
jgi:hypothetical protein